MPPNHLAMKNHPGTITSFSISQLDHSGGRTDKRDIFVKSLSLSLEKERTYERKAL